MPRSFPYPVTLVQFAKPSGPARWPHLGRCDARRPSQPRTDVALAGRLGPNPSSFLGALARSPSRPLPVIVTSDLTGRSRSTSAAPCPDPHAHRRARVPVYVAGDPARDHLLPGAQRVRGAHQDLRLARRSTTYAWAKGPPSSVGRALGPSLGPDYPPQRSTRSFTTLRSSLRRDVPLMRRSRSPPACSSCSGSCSTSRPGSGRRRSPRLSRGGWASAASRDRLALPRARRDPRSSPRCSAAGSRSPPPARSPVTSIRCPRTHPPRSSSSRPANSRSSRRIHRRRSSHRRRDELVRSPHRRE